MVVASDADVAELAVPILALPLAEDKCPVAMVQRGRVGCSMAELRRGASVVGRSALGVGVRLGGGPGVLDQRPAVLNRFRGSHPRLDLLHASLTGRVGPASQEAQDVGQQAMS